MLTRLLLALAFSLALTPALAADTGPGAPIRPIYQRVLDSYDSQADHNEDSGAFIWKDDKSRRQYFSARTAKLWRDADRKTPKGDQGPMGFDPVTNSQDSLVRAFDITVEKQAANTATVLVRISEKPGPIAQPAPRDLIRYDMVRENGRWLIDDIRGTIETEWSVRKILSEYKG